MIRSPHASIRNLGIALSQEMRWYFRYADDCMAIAQPTFPALMWSPLMPKEAEDSPFWIYPLCRPHNATQLAIKLDSPEWHDDGSHSQHYLCLLITIKAPSGSQQYQELHTAPYDKRKAFMIPIAVGTNWLSCSSVSIKMAALMANLPLAIMASTTQTALLDFIYGLIDQLQYVFS